MNTYKKYCPNVFVAQCDIKYDKGDEITVTTKYGKENNCIVHNLVFEKDGFYYYSITRVDGFNNQQRAKNKIDKLNSWASSADQKSKERYEASNKHSDFLSLAEPIKVGHHSEGRHRKIIKQANDDMRKCVEYADKAEEYRSRTDYWEHMSTKIDLSMPESLEFYGEQLEYKKEYHKGLKDGSIERRHSYSLTYAKKECNDLEKKVKLAKILWG